MPVATLTRMTADEFLEHHVDDRWIELVNGEIVEIPMPGFDHGYVATNAGFLIKMFVDQHKLGRVAGNDTFIRTRVDGVRGADVMFISYKRIPADAPRPKGAIDPPVELVVEVRSPSDSRNDMIAKAEEYCEAGVEVVLILDPTNSSATIVRPDGSQVRLKTEDTLTLPDILPGFSVPIAKFFE